MMWPVTRPASEFQLTRSPIAYLAIPLFLSIKTISTSIRASFANLNLATTHPNLQARAADVLRSTSAALAWRFGCVVARLRFAKLARMDVEIVLMERKRGMAKYAMGDRVSWNSEAGRVTGHIIKIHE